MLNSSYAFKLTLNLILDPKADSSLRLSVMVHEFKLQGSEGSAQIGRPSHILGYESVKTMVETMEGLLAGSRITALPASSPICSQENSVTEEVDFSTQIDYMKERSSVDGEPKSNKAPVDLAALLKNAAARNFKTASDNLSHVPQPTPEKKKVAMASEVVARASDTALRNSISPDSEISKSQEGARARKDSQLQPTHNNSESAGLQQPTQALAFVDQLQRDFPFEGLKRVPRRYARIPGDQKALLESQDSWFQPKEDGRSYHASIPAKVLDDLMNFIDRDSCSQQLHGCRSITSTPDPEKDGEHDSAAEKDSLRNETDKGDKFSKSNANSLSKQQSNSLNVSPNARSHFPSNSPQINLVLEETDDGEAEVGFVSWPSSPELPNAKNHFPSSGPQMNLVAEGEDGGAEDGFVSWSSSPEPKDATLEHQARLQKKSGNNVPSQQLDSPFGPPPSSKPRPKPIVRAPIEFPSSSPTGQEELELAVPLAVSDVIEAEDETEETSLKSPHEPPPSNPRGSNFVQVEHTPLPKFRSSSNQVSFRRSGTKRSVAEDRTWGGLSSDAVIPATFHGSGSSSKQVSSSTEQRSTGTITIPLPSLEPNQNPIHSQREARCISKKEEVGLLTLRTHLVEMEEQVPQVATASERIESLRIPDLLPDSSAPAPPSNQQMLNSALPTLSSRMFSSPPLAPASSLSKDAEQQYPITDIFQDPLKSSVQLPPTESGARLKKLLRKLDDQSGLGGEYPAETRTKGDVMKYINERLLQETLKINKELAEKDDAIAIEVSTPRNEENPTEANGGSNDFAKHEMAPRVVVFDEYPEVLTSASDKEMDIDHARQSFHSQIIRSPSPGSTPELSIPNTITRPAVDQQLSQGSEFPALQLNYVVGHITLEKASNRQQMLTGANAQKSEGRPVENIQQSLADQSIFRKYKSMYPDYSGNEKCFTKALVYMEWMEQSGNGVHRFLCDDFLRVYPEYEVAIVKLPPQERVTGRVYYDRNIKRPVYQQGLIVPENFSADLLTLNQEDVEIIRSRFNAPIPSDESRKRAMSQITAPVEQHEENRFTASSSTHAQTIPPGKSSPVLGPSSRFVNPQTRARFFETPSQIQSVTKQPELPAASADLDTETSVEKARPAKRTLPWLSSSPVPKFPPLSRSNIPCSRPRTHIDLTTAASVSRKRRLTRDETRRATLPPQLRARSPKPLPSQRAEQEHSSVLQKGVYSKVPSRQASTRSLHAARSSPELNGYTSQWVANLQLPGEAVADSSQHVAGLQPAKTKKRKSEEEAPPRRKSSGVASVVESSDRRKSFAGFLARQAQRGRVRGCLPSNASISAKSMSTKPKEKSPRVFEEPRTQGWH